MAQKEENPTVSSLKQKVLEDYLTCIICSDTYEDPHQLKCQHTFCLKCLTAYIQNSTFLNSFPCPVCRTNVSIHRNRQVDSQKNLFIDNMLTFFKNLKEFCDVGDEIRFPTSVSKFCNLCNEDRESDSYCPVCFMWLCQPCTRGHQKIQVTKSHALMHVSDFHEFIDSLVKEKCSRMVGLKEDIEERISSLDGATYITSETKSKVEFEIKRRHQALQQTIENQKNGLLLQLDVEYSGISNAIDQSRDDLVKINQRACGLIELYEDLQKEPTNLQGTEVDDLEKAADLIVGDFQCVDSSLNSSQVPSIEYKSVVGNDTLDESGSALGTIFLRSNPSSSVQYTGEGVTCKMYKGSCDHQITGLSVFNDKNYLIVSGNKFLCLQNSNEINMMPRTHSWNTCVWGVTQLNRDKVLLTNMESCLGSGKITIFRKNQANLFQIWEVMVEGLTSPRGVCVGQGGFFMVCDQYDRCIYKFDHEGQLKRMIKKSKDGSPLFVQPMFVTENKNGDIIVSDHGSYVKILSRYGDLKHTYISSKPNSEFWGVSTDRDGNILVADLNYGIHILTENGEFKMLRNDFPYGVHPVAIGRHPQHNTFMIGNDAGEIYFMS